MISTALLIALQQALDVEKAVESAVEKGVEEGVDTAITNAEASFNLSPEELIEKIVEWCVTMGGNIIGAILIYIVGRFIIKLVKKALNAFLERRKIEPTVKSFVQSMVSISLTVLLVIAIISQLGLETTSFAALLASAGVAIGMAFSGNLQNFAGGVIMLLLRPFKVGDYIVAQGVEGYVKEIQIFHTVLTTYDNRTIFVANGPLSSGVITNMYQTRKRRVELIVSVEYGANFEQVKKVLLQIINDDPMILKEPEPFIAIHDLNSSSVDIVVRAWVKSGEYWDVHYKLREKVYEEFNKAGINFPFPQLTVHQAEN